MIEDIEKNKARLARIIKKTQIYSGLNLNDDFKTWKKDVVLKRLNGYQEIAFSQNLDTEEGKKQAISNIIRYQELKFIVEDVFKIFETTEVQARKKLKELEKVS